MAVTVAELKELRELGAKRVEFTTKGEIQAVEFFGDAPVIPEKGDPVTVEQEPEIPPDYNAAFTMLGHKPKKKEASA